MKVTEHIQQSKGSTQFSFEILPPLKGQNIQGIFDTITPLMEFEPPFIDVTYHREEYQYSEAGNGLWEKRIVRKRPGTVGICSAIQTKFKVDAIPHILCGGFTREDTENFLIDLDFLGIDNVVALRGDAVKNETYFKAEVNGNKFASELVTQIVDLNNGIYLDDHLQNTSKTDFCIGVAGYPEKHMEAPNFDTDLMYLKQKIDNGAEYIITQMFFDNNKFFDFVNKCRAIGITVPIIPGLKPLATLSQLNLLPQRFKVDLPDDLVKEVLAAKNNAAIKQIGIEWCTQQSKELIAAGTPIIHYYSMGRADNISQIITQATKN